MNLALKRLNHAVHPLPCPLFSLVSSPGTRHINLLNSLPENQNVCWSTSNKGKTVLRDRCGDGAAPCLMELKFHGSL